MARPIKVVLVYPSSHDSVQTLYAFNKKQMIGYKPPQSVLILATYLRSKGFDDVHCLDAQVDEFSPEQTAERLIAMQPDVIGITSWTDFWYPVWKTLTVVRERLPNAVLVVGGPHATVYPEETLTASPADYVVAGDGEDVLLNLVDALQHGRPVAPEAGLWRKTDGRAVAPPKPFAVVHDITAIPPPDRTLLDYRRYSSVLTPSDYETTMVTSRGCPYKCVFCKMDVQKVYARTAEQVVEEFRQIAALGITDVQVYDDTFTWGAARAMDICRGIINSGIKVNWAIRDRVNRATPELYRLLRQAGCNRVHFGVETGSPRVLKESGKFITLEQVHKAMDIARSVDMTVMCYFMFGFIGETMEDAMLTVGLAKKLNPDYASFGVLIPYPGTEIYRTGVAKGLIPTDYWREFALNPQPDFRIPYVIEDILSRQTLLDLKSRATRSFYMQPQRILREIRKLHSFSDLVSKVRLGAAIFADGLSPKSSVYRY